MEQHSGDFSVTVRDVRQLNQTEGDLLTLLWVLEGSVNLTEAEGVPQPLAADELAIVNRNRRWSLRSAGTNAVMILTLSASWLTRLDSAFFAVDYQITPRPRDAEDGLRRLMRQLLVSGLVKHPGHYRLEANRWLSEIALLLATRFSQPIASTPRRGAENWSRRIASVVARIDANYQRRLSLQEVAAAAMGAGGRKSAGGGRCAQPLAADELAIVNRNRRWSLRSAVPTRDDLTLSASWLTRLDSAFCCRLSDNARAPGCGGRPAPPDAPAAGEGGQASRPLPTGGQPLAE